MNANKKVLIAAKQKVERGWTQDFFAKDADGRTVFWDSDEACSWCASGAIYAAAHELLAGSGADFDAVDVLERLIGSGVPAWNDNPLRTKAEVLAAFDKAIELAQ